MKASYWEMCSWSIHRTLWIVLLLRIFQHIPMTLRFSKICDLVTESSSGRGTLMLLLRITRVGVSRGDTLFELGGTTSEDGSARRVLIHHDILCVRYLMSP